MIVSFLNIKAKFEKSIEIVKNALLVLKGPAIVNNTTADRKFLIQIENVRDSDINCKFDQSRFTLMPLHLTYIYISTLGRGW